MTKIVPGDTMVRLPVERPKYKELEKVVFCVNYRK